MFEVKCELVHEKEINISLIGIYTYFNLVSSQFVYWQSGNLNKKGFKKTQTVHETINLYQTIETMKAGFVTYRHKQL